MSRQLDVLREERQRKLDVSVLWAIDGGMEEALGHAGAVLNGFTVIYKGDSVLVVVKVTLAGKAQVAFVGAPTLVDALVKVSRQANRDELRWKEDQYVGPG